MVYLWKIPNDYPEKLIGEYDKKCSPDRFVFKMGGVISADIGEPVIRFNASVNELRELDDLANDAMVPVVGERLSELLLELAPDDIQLIGVEIKAGDGDLRGYKLLNIINKVAGIDKEKSEFTLVPGTEKIMGFRHLEYNNDCLGKHALARDAEYSSNLIVSQMLAEKLLDLNFSGVGLYLPEEIGK